MSRIHVRWRRNGASVEFQGSQAFFERVIEPCWATPKRATSRAEPGRPLVGPPSQRPSNGHPTPTQEPAEAGYRPPRDLFGIFQRQAQLKDASPASTIAAFAFFLWNYEKKEEFSEDEVLGCFREQGLQAPADSDVPSLYGHLVSRRILEPGREAQRWRITPKGLDHVRHRLLSA